MSAANIQKNRQLKPGRKVRVPLSCEPCRSRKLKCNREQPCQNCCVRDSPAGCFYRGVDKPVPTAAGPGSGSVGGSGSGTGVKANASGMQQRIDRLESLVTSLMAQGQVQIAAASRPMEQHTPPETSSSSLDASPVYVPFETGGGGGGGGEAGSIDDMPAVQHGMGVMTVKGDSSQYRGTTHWHDLLSELSDLKSYWGQVQDEEDSDDILQDDPVASGFEGPSLFCGIVPNVSMDEILASLPPKPQADRLMVRFWDEANSPVPTFHILHQTTFMREYEIHWKNPRATKVMWVGLLFAVFSQTMLSYSLCEDEPPEYEGISQSISELYRLRTAQCLMLGDISKCSPYTLETMVYYTMVEWARMRSNEPKIWLMIGLLVRVALQMGYHRDPSHYPEISVFRGEIRRRLWGFIHRTDALMSFLVGLPGMIRASEQDVNSPRNLHDWEMNEEMTELPPSRPISELTTVSYLLAKGRILDVMGKIVDLMSSLHLWDYDRVLELDKELLRVFTDELPECFKIPIDQDLIDDTPSIVNKRIQIAFLYYQGMCVLHRKFLTQGRGDERFKPSRDRCIESAIAMLTQQYHLWYQSAIENSYASKGWYRVSYTSQEYILAAMIVIQELRQRGQAREGFNGDGETDMPKRDSEEREMAETLQRACLIWKVAKDNPEAAKVYKVLSRMTQAVLWSSGKCMPNLLPNVSGMEGVAAVVLPDAGLVPVDMGMGVPGEMDIDWSAWDTFIEGSSFEDVYGSVSLQ